MSLMSNMQGSDAKDAIVASSADVEEATVAARGSSEDDDLMYPFIQRLRGAGRSSEYLQQVCTCLYCPLVLPVSVSVSLVACLDDFKCCLREGDS